MAFPTLAMKFSELYTEVGYWIYGDGTSLSADQKTRAKRYVNMGYRAFLAGVDPYKTPPEYYDWGFLSPRAEINLWPSASGTATGTYPGSVGTITATAAAFYPSMVGHNVAFTVSGSEFRIIGYTSTKVVTVATDPSAESAKAFTVTADGRYALPDDYAEIIHDPRYGTSGAFTGLKQTDPATIDQLRTGTGDSTGSPYMYAIYPQDLDSAIGGRWWLYVHPVPGSLITMPYRYRVMADKMTDDDEYPYGAAQHSQTILAACLKMCENIISDSASVPEVNFKELMGASIRQDAASVGRNIGYNGDGMPPMVLDRRANDVTYST